jgi:hypothetical protein
MSHELENSMVIGAQAQIDAEEMAASSREALDAVCHAALKERAFDALMGDMVGRIIPTHKQSVKWSALAMVQDQLGGTKGDALLIEMIVLLRNIAKSGAFEVSVYAPFAKALLKKFAEYHADYFAADLADEIEDDRAAGRA